MPYLRWMLGVWLLLLVACTPAPPAGTPSCPVAHYPHTSALLAALPSADYACTEEIAAALRPRADTALVDALLALAVDTQSDLRARRNALRVLGRLAESPLDSSAATLMQRTRMTATQQVLDQILASERDSLLLQDAIWIYDTFYFPSVATQPVLERISADVDLAPALRTRAANALSRLITQRVEALTPADLHAIATGLRSDAPGVRAAAAWTIARLPDAQLHPTLRAIFATQLAAAEAAEPSLTLPEDAPDLRGAVAFSDLESIPTSLSARAAIARAQDRLAAGDQHFTALRSAYEALALPNRQANADFLIRSGLPAADLAPLLAHATLAQSAYRQIVGPALSTPLPGEATGRITLLIFANQAIYRDYMRAFTPFQVDVDGIYNEAERTLYTHQRRPDQSENTLEETLQHELAHAMTAATLFAGTWSTVGYHTEPKGWADEGLAEVVAGAYADAGGGAVIGPRPAQLARLCTRAPLPALSDLLAQRVGYDLYGRFDYDAAWALHYYLITTHPEAARNLYSAYRTGRYTLAAWPQLVGVPLATFEADWHAAIMRWCD